MLRIIHQLALRAHDSMEKLTEPEVRTIAQQLVTASTPTRDATRSAKSWEQITGAERPAI